MTPSLKDLAKFGAQARLNEIRAERDALLQMFPELKEGRGRRRAPADGATPRRARGRMSAEARRAVAERMRKYWAERRAAKANGGAEGAAPTPPRAAGRKAGRRKGRKK